MNVADVQSTMKSFCHQASDGASQAAQWMKRSVTVLGQNAYDLLKKIATITSEAFSVSANFVRDSFYASKDWTVKNFHVVKDYVATHPSEMRAAGIGALAALVIAGIGYALCCRGSEQTA